MSTIAELQVPVSEFALRRTVAETDCDVEIERVVAYDPESVMPYVWFSDPDTSRTDLDAVLDADPSVKESTLLTDLEGEYLYRLHWVDDVTVIVHTLTEERATILEASVEDDHWRFRILFPERDALSRTYDFATDRGLTIDVQKVHQLEENRHGKYGLTEAQHETLVAALEAGYYEIPRKSDMEDLATDLDVSHQALSERLRRAHQTLVEEAVSLDAETDDD